MTEDIKFDRLDTSDWASRSMPEREEQASRTVDLDLLFAYLSYCNAGRLPRSIADLASFGLPEELVDGLRALVVEGNAEADVVRAFFDAVGGLLARVTIGVKVSRQLARALRHQFARPDECADLRAAVRALLQAAMSEAAA